MELYAAFYRGFKEYFRYPMWIISDLLASPLWILMLLIPVLLFLPSKEWSNPTTYQFFYWGMVFWDVVGMALWSFGMAIRREQQLGTIEHLFLSNSNRMMLFASRIATMLPSFLISILYLALIIGTFFKVSITVINPAMLILSLFFSLMTAAGFGAVYGALVLKLKQPGALSNILQFAIIGISGLFFPVERLPGALRMAAYASPFTYCVDLVRASAMGSPTLMPLWHEVLFVAAMAAFLNMLGLGAVRIIESNNKKTGKLGAF